MNNCIGLLIFLATFGLHSIASAQYGYSEDSSFSSSGSSKTEFIMGLAFFYTGDNFELSVDRNRSDLLLQGTLGYRYNDWLFGLNYDSDTEKQSFISGTTVQNVSWTRTAIGATIGYFLSSVLVSATYYVSPELNTTDELGSLSTDYSNSSGVQFTIGYNYKIIPEVSLGLQLAYRSFQYKQSATTTGSSDGLFRQAMVDPMLVLMVHL